MVFSCHTWERPPSPTRFHRFFKTALPTPYEVTWLPSRRGENVAEIHERAASFLRAFFARLDLAALGAPVASDGELDLGRHKNILFVGHGASVIAIARELAGDRHLSMRVRCCSLSILVPKPDAKRSHNPSTPSLSPSPKGGDRTAGNVGIGQWKLVQSAAADSYRVVSKETGASRIGNT